MLVEEGAVSSVALGLSVSAEYYSGTQFAVRLGGPSVFSTDHTTTLADISVRRLDIGVCPARLEALVGPFWDVPFDGRVFSPSISQAFDVFGPDDARGAKWCGIASVRIHMQSMYLSLIHI